MQEIRKDTACTENGASCVFSIFLRIIWKLWKQMISETFLFLARITNIGNFY